MRNAASDIRLPAVAGPSIGISVTSEDLPFAGFVTLPCCSVVTSGVLSHNPGSVGLPSVATVFPSALVGVLAGAAAAARCAGVVVSNASAVLAAAGGGGAAVSGASVASPTSDADATKGSMGAVAPCSPAFFPAPKPKRDARSPQPARPTTRAPEIKIRIMAAAYLRARATAISQMPLAPT